MFVRTRTRPAGMQASFFISHLWGTDQCHRDLCGTHTNESTDALSLFSPIGKGHPSVVAHDQQEAPCEENTNKFAFLSVRNLSKLSEMPKEKSFF